MKRLVFYIMFILILPFLCFGASLLTKPESTAIGDLDIFYLIVDPAGTPLDKKVSFGTIKTELSLSGTNTGDNSANTTYTIGSATQAWDTDLDTYATIPPSANVQTLLGSANYQSFISTLDGAGDWDFWNKAVDQGDADLTLPAEAAFQSIAVADLADAATPSVLTKKETINKCISNYKSTGADHVFTMPAAHAAGNVIFPVGDGFQIDIEPYSTTYFIFNGTAMAASEHIQNTSDTKYTELTGYCINDEGTLRWHFKSNSSDWVEATP